MSLQAGSEVLKTICKSTDFVSKLGKISKLYFFPTDYHVT